MARFDLGKDSRLVIIPFRPFQHLLKCGSRWIVWTASEASRAGRAADPGCVPDGCRANARSRAHARDAGDGIQNADGRLVRITERVVAFHRASQRNDVEMIFSIRHPDGRQEKLVIRLDVAVFLPATRSNTSSPMRVPPLRRCMGISTGRRSGIFPGNDLRAEDRQRNAGGNSEKRRSGIEPPQKEAAAELPLLEPVHSLT